MSQQLFPHRFARAIRPAFRSPSGPTGSGQPTRTLGNYPRRCTNIPGSLACQETLKRPKRILTLT
jgi:hypothetical protein